MMEGSGRAELLITAAAKHTGDGEKQRGVGQGPHRVSKVMAP